MSPLIVPNLLKPFYAALYYRLDLTGSTAFSYLIWNFYEKYRASILM